MSFYSVSKYDVVKAVFRGYFIALSAYIRKEKILKSIYILSFCLQNLEKFLNHNVKQAKGRKSLRSGQKSLKMREKNQ